MLILQAFCYYGKLDNTKNQTIFNITNFSTIFNNNEIPFDDTREMRPIQVIETTREESYDNEEMINSDFEEKYKEFEEIFVKKI